MDIRQPRGARLALSLSMMLGATYFATDYEKVMEVVSADRLDPITLGPLDTTWISRALLLSDEAGWNQTAADWQVFFTHGTVLGFTSGDRLVATSAVLPYGREFGWLSMVLVAAQWRRQGLATRLVTACTSLLRDSRRAVILDAAPDARDIYRKLGFIPLCRMERWEGRGGGVGFTSDPVDLAGDLVAFGADRRFLLDDFLARPGSLAFQSPNGFALLRRGSVAAHLGPIAAEPGEAAVLASTAIRTAEGRLFVDVLDAATALIPTLMSQGFRPQRRFTRMALGLSALPGNPASLLAAAGPEFG